MSGENLPEVVELVADVDGGALFSEDTDLPFLQLGEASPAVRVLKFYIDRLAPRKNVEHIRGALPGRGAEPPRDDV